MNLENLISFYTDLFTKVWGYRPLQTFSGWTERDYLQEIAYLETLQNQIEETDFGDCDDDVMEVSVYDVNNNLLPQKSGNTVAYIKTGDIKNYLYFVFQL